MKFEYARISDSLFQQEYSLSRIQEYVEMLIYATISFSLPFLLGHEQLLVGAVVNCALVLAALNAQYRDIRYVTPFLIQVYAGD